MPSIAKGGSAVAGVARAVWALLLLALVAAMALPAAASQPAEVIVLPGAPGRPRVSPLAAVQPSMPATCSPATSSAATSAAAPPSLFIDTPAGRRAVGKPPTCAMTCCLWPVASPARAICTTSAPVRPWPATSSRRHRPR